MPRSLVHLVRERYLTSIRSVQPPSRWKVLVVDSFTQSLLNSVLKLNDILQQNVSTVENIEHNRSPQSSFEACYLLTPTSANVDRLIRDLSPPPPGKQPQYAAGHIFFVDSLSDVLLQRLTTSSAEPQLRQLIEMFNNFWPIEAQAFSLKSPQSFFTLFQPIGGAYGPDQSEAMSAIEGDLFFATQTLLNVCVTLNEFPLIRYYNPQHPALGPLAPIASNQGTMNSAYSGSARLARLGGGGSSREAASTGEHFTRKLAFRLQQAIDDYVRDNEPKSDPGRPRGILFITDRTMDTIAPLLHEFSYQAMANDLLPIEDGNRYHYRFYTSDGKREDKDATLSDDDAVWTGIRHLHIAEAIDRLSRDFQAHAGEAGAYTDNASSLNDMRDMLASLPHMQETKDKLSLHLTLAQDCMSRFEKTRLPQQAMVEQNCATRLTPEGQKPRTLVEEMVPLLDDRSVSNADKVRIIALYIMYCEGVNDEDRKRLFQHARLSLHEMDAVNNLVHLGAQVVKDPSTSSAWDGWFRKGKRKQQPGENEYELSRYQPLLKLMIEDHFAGKLDQTTYPYVRDAPPEMPTGAASYLSAGLASGGRDSPLARVAGQLGGSGGSGSGGSSARPTGAPSSLRSAKPTWHQKPRGAGGAAGGGGGGGSGGSGDRYGMNGGSAGAGGMGGGSGGSGASMRDETRQRVLVFVAGGMTYSEMRSIYQISNKMHKDGYIGSTDVFTPESFLNALKTFGKAGNSGPLGRGGPVGASNGHGGGLPSGASVLSPPSNEVSGLRSKARQAQHQQPSPPQPDQSHFEQSNYDRRFGGASSTATRPAAQHHHTHTGATPGHQQQSYGRYGGGEGGAGSSRDGYGGGAVPSHVQSFNGAIGPSTSQASLGRASLASSTASGRDEKAKKKRNVFGFKKSDKSGS
ncbi:Sec1-like protein [Jaminaea rosea]|uniref:Sec1-like protein n=1 Tax=Jaminaea rosea TaxID=1569628 RepID=A0A316UWE9_9BASI|nr:Sec1-like protein [Jaminaea rosea]PWN29630.1 Sec1-like protein [Jaminaea rosea]